MNKIKFIIGVVVLLLIFIGAGVYVHKHMLEKAQLPITELAEDTVLKLDYSITPENMFSKDDDKQTLNANTVTPFVVIYDREGKPVAGSALIGDKIPVIQANDLKSSDNKSNYKTTWQLNNSIKLETTVISTDKYYVVAAGPISKMEKRELMILSLLLICCLTFIVLWYLVCSRFGLKKSVENSSDSK